MKRERETLVFGPQNKEKKTSMCQAGVMTNTWRSGTEPGYQGQERAHSSCAACMSLSDTDKVTVKVRGQGAAVVYPTHCMHAISLELGPPQTYRHTCTIYISK